MNLKKLKAFTLIELLVVIAIIAIMAALAIPIIAKNRNPNRLHIGDKITLKSLGLRGVVDRVEFDHATIVVVGRDGYPAKMTVNLQLLEKE